MNFYEVYYFRGNYSEHTYFYECFQNVTCESGCGYGYAIASGTAADSDTSTTPTPT